MSMINPILRYLKDSKSSTQIEAKRVVENIANKIQNL